MAKRSELNADLILSSGFELQLEDRSFATLGEHAVVRYRELTAFLDATYSQ